MNSNLPPVKQFYVYPADKVEGPFQLVELAGLLQDHITGETPVLLEGESDDKWVPFQTRNEYHLAKEMPKDAIDRHFKEQAEAAESPFTFKRLKVLFWVFPPLFLLIGYRVVLFIIRMESQQTIEPSDLADPSGSN